MRLAPSSTFPLVSLLLLANCSAAGQVPTQTATAQTGMLLWQSFTCSAYAGMAGNKEEEERLFTLGYDSGKRFMEAVRSGKITAEEIRTTVPIAVTMRMRGPSADFSLGAIYADAGDETYTRIVQTGLANEPLAAKDWVTDPEIQKNRATSEFRTRNCTFLK